MVKEMVPILIPMVDGIDDKTTKRGIMGLTDKLKWSNEIVPIWGNI